MTKNQWQALVNIKWKSGTPSTAWESWKGNSKIKAAWSTLGDWDCMLWVDVQTPDELEEFVWNNIRKNQWVDGTQTHWAKHWF
jgi:hypothetical protein